MKKLINIVLLLIIITWSLPVFAAPVTIRLLHVNDFHGFANPVKETGDGKARGGAAWLAARIKALRAGDATLLLAAGDMIQGDNWANLFQGKSSIALLNQLSFDAMVVGNHEFDFGQKALRQRIAEAKFPILAANLEGMPGLKPYVIREVAGLRVAIVGLVTDDVPLTSNPANSAGLVFYPPLATAERLIAKLRSQADLIILLTHTGYAADRMLAEKLPGNLIIVGGHSHTRLEKPVQIGASWVAQSWEHGKSLGVVDISVDQGRIAAVAGRLEDIWPIDGAGDRETALLVDRYNAIFDDLLSAPAGETAVDLIGNGVRQRETNLGNLTADIVRQTAGAEVAIINGGSIRTGINKGEIKVRNVYASLPFNNYVVALRLSGKDLRLALEHGVSAIEEASGRFPQVAGLKFTYSRLAPVGQRVKSIEVNRLPLDENREYRVATLDFLAVGGDGYQIIGKGIRRSADFSLQGEDLLFCDPGHWLRDLVVDYLRREGAVAPTVERRIIELP